MKQNKKVYVKLIFILMAVIFVAGTIYMVYEGKKKKQYGGTLLRNLFVKI